MEEMSRIEASSIMYTIQQLTTDTSSTTEIHRDEKGLLRRDRMTPSAEDPYAGGLKRKERDPRNEEGGSTIIKKRERKGMCCSVRKSLAVEDLIYG